MRKAAVIFFRNGSAQPMALTETSDLVGDFLSTASWLPQLPQNVTFLFPKTRIFLPSSVAKQTLRF
jgi:hypothetical protein